MRKGPNSCRARCRFVSAASGRNDVDAHARDRGAGVRFQFAKLNLSRSPRTRDCPPPFNVIDPGQLIGALRPMHDSRRARS